MIACGVDAGRQRPVHPAAARRPAARRRTRRRPPAARGGRAARPAGRPPGPRPARRASNWLSYSRCSALAAGRANMRRARARGHAPGGRRAAASAAGGQLALGQERRQALGLLDDRAQHVERGDVARALPDRVQRRVAVQQRQARLLDEAVAAQALERLGGMGGGALGDPVLHDRGGEAAERARRPARRSCARRAARSRSPPRTRSPGRRARCASPAGRPAARRTPSGGGRGGSPPAVPRRSPVVEPSRQSRRVWLTMRMIAGTPRPSSPTSQPEPRGTRPRRRAASACPSLSLSRWNSIPGPRSTRKHDRPAGRLGQDEEHVARRIGAEPLVAVQLIAAVADRLGAGDVGAHVGAALALGHRHPGQRAVA